jgi:hypothetical protein
MIFFRIIWGSHLHLSVCNGYISVFDESRQNGNASRIQWFKILLYYMYVESSTRILSPIKNNVFNWDHGFPPCLFVSVGQFIKLKHSFAFYDDFWFRIFRHSQIRKIHDNSQVKNYFFGRVCEVFKKKRKHVIR